MEGSHTFICGVQRLNKGCLFKRNVGRHFYQAVPHNPIHDPYILSKSAAGRFKTRRTSYVLICRTLGEGLLAAVITVAARYVVKDRDAIPDLEIMHAVSYSRDNSRGFMAEDARS